MFLEIEPSFLQAIATDSDRIPTLYYSKYWLVKKVFWMRLRLIDWLISKFSKNKNSCLDFGGGGGVFLPTLAHRFRNVVLVDLEDVEACQVVNKYKLRNVKLVKEDILQVTLPDAPFDVIVAADVLEHFQDLSVPVPVLRKWLKKDGILYTSLPTENFIYTGLRKVFNITKPWDHYHTGYEVESYLKTHGFKQIHKVFVPLFWNILPLFLISAWKLDD